MKWEQSNDDYVGHLTDGEKPAFLLLPHHPINKSFFKISANIYITNIETDFILDIDIDSFVQFDIDTNIPTIRDLYTAYMAAREDWKETILKQSITKGILIRRSLPPTTFENLEEYFMVVLAQTYSPN